MPNCTDHPRNTASTQTNHLGTNHRGDKYKTPSETAQIIQPTRSTQMRIPGACKAAVYQALVYFAHYCNWRWRIGDVMFQTMGWTSEMVGHLYWIFAKDDILLFTGSAEQRGYMVDTLVTSLGKVGLKLNAAKQRLWQLKRNHQRHWRRALVWRLQCWLHRRFVLQLGVANFIQFIFENLTCIAGKCFDVLSVRHLTSLGTSFPNFLTPAPSQPPRWPLNQPWHTVLHSWRTHIDQQLEYHGVKMWSTKWWHAQVSFKGVARSHHIWGSDCYNKNIQKPAGNGERQPTCRVFNNNLRPWIVDLSVGRLFWQ